MKKDVLVKNPCSTVEKYSLDRHQKSTIHQEAEDLEAQFILSSEGHGIQSAMVQHTTLEKTALIGAFKCMYWLAKEEIAHTTHYPSLLELAKSLGCDYLNLLRKGETINYESQRSMQEILECLSDSISEPILQDMRKSRYFSLMLDETTDIAVMKQLSVMARYLTPDKKVKTAFLELIDLPDGKADTIVRVIKDFLLKIDVPIQKLAGLGSDGASVMVGRTNGVAVQLKEESPSLINVHCVAHRLALASGQATDNIPYLKKFKMIVQQLFKFYQNSAVRMAGLKEIECVLGDPQVKLKEILDTRWLSHERAVTAVRLSLRSLILSLEREASERHEATAAGLVSFVKDVKFVAAIYMLSDVLPHLCRLSKTFQKVDIDFTMVDPLVSACKTTVENLLDKPGKFMLSLEAELDKLKELNLQMKSMDLQEFKTGIYETYIRNVAQNLTDRFPDNRVLEGLSIFDLQNLNKDDPTDQEWVQNDKLEIVTDHFQESEKLFDVKVEWHNLRQLMVNIKEPMSFRQSLEKIASLEELYPLLANYAQAALVLTVSTADCERSFSSMNRIKSVLRNRLSQRVLNHLMTISTEGQPLKDFNWDVTVSLYGEKKKRQKSLI